MWRFLMDACSIESWFGRDFAGGIGSMCQGIRGLKIWGRKHERPGYGCGPIRSRCQRGSGERGTDELPDASPRVTYIPVSTEGTGWCICLCRQPDYSRKRHDDALQVRGKMANKLVGDTALQDSRARLAGRAR